jgi:ATP-dependent Lon protease
VATLTSREIKDLQKRAEEMKWTDAAKELFKKNIEKLERMHPVRTEYSVIYNHLDLMLDLPWGVYTEDSYDLKKCPESARCRPLRHGENKRPYCRISGGTQAEG